jgi:hypothetical protein
MGKVSALTALTGAGAATTDKFYVVDASAGAAGSKHMTAEELCNVYPAVISTAMTGSGAHATQDKVPFYDNGVAKTILVDELMAAIIALGSALAGASAHATQDHVLFSDNGVNKKMLVTELQIAMATLATAITSGLHATEDTILYDDNGVAKKITVPNLFAGMVALASAITTGWNATEDHLIYDDNGVTKKTTLPNLLAGLIALNTTALTGANTHTTQDSFVISDNGTPKSITVAEMENIACGHPRPAQRQDRIGRSHRSRVNPDAAGSYRLRGKDQSCC